MIGEIVSKWPPSRRNRGSVIYDLSVSPLSADFLRFAPSGAPAMSRLAMYVSLPAFLRQFAKKSQDLGAGPPCFWPTDTQAG